MKAVAEAPRAARLFVVLAGLLTAQSILACTVCFGDADGQATQGAVDAAIVLGVWAYGVIGVGVGVAVWKARRGRRGEAQGAA